MIGDYRELLIGCGHSREKRFFVPGTSQEWKNLYLLDHSIDCYDSKKDSVGFFLCDLDTPEWLISTFVPDRRNERERLRSSLEGNFIPSETEQCLMDSNADPMRFKPNLFDEIHAYEVIEHLGSQGDAHAFLDFFAEAWRVLKPGGYFLATVPSRFSEWLWGDPSHRRAILPASLTFLDQMEYVKQLDGSRKRSMSDFRSFYKADFVLKFSHDNRENFSFVLQSVKPSRINGV